jgi:hypothetical protein
MPRWVRREVCAPRLNHGFRIRKDPPCPRERDYCGGTCTILITSGSEVALVAAAERMEDRAAG